MALTPGGYPYVEPSDFATDYPAVSEELATKLDTRLSPVAVAMATGNLTTMGVGVTFPNLRFTAPPDVVAVANNGGPAIVTITGISANGFTVRAFDHAGSGLETLINWIAVLQQ